MIVNEPSFTFSSIDVLHTNNMVVGACGPNLEFISEAGSRTPGYAARYSNQKAFTPRKILFVEAGQNILTMTPDNKSLLCRLDTETGKNIGELAVKLFHEDVPSNLDTVVQHEKFGQTKSNTDVSLVGISGNSIVKLRWDTRQSVVKNYVVQQDRASTIPIKKFKFTAVTTTGKGHIAAGSNNGTVRLFTRGTTFKRAKTEISQLADPIIGIDASANGEWLVWTTEKYLVILKTVWNDHQGDHSGYEVSLPAEHKKVLVLKISPEDIEKHNIPSVKFTPARFDNGPFEGNEDIIE